VSSVAIKAALINAITLALIDSGIELLDKIVASSAGFLPQFQKTVVHGSLTR
jgi:ribonuclease PH